MTGDLGSAGEGARAQPAPAARRPDFLPHVDRHPPPPEPAPEPAPARRGGIGWSIALIAAAAVQLVSAFLPWAQALVVVDLFGRPLTRDLGTVAGIDADDLVISVPVLALVTIGMACWGRADPRITALGAVTGTLTLLACALFVLRLDDVRDRLPDEGLGVGYEVGLRYGWYVALATSLLVIGFSLAHPATSGRRARRTSGPAPLWTAPSAEAGSPGTGAAAEVDESRSERRDAPDEPDPPGTAERPSEPADGGSPAEDRHSGGEEPRSGERPDGWTPPGAESGGDRRRKRDRPQEHGRP